jgi:hypothetical protein
MSTAKQISAASGEKTHWKKLINPDYIGAYALQPGQDMTVTIASVSRQVVVSTGGKKEECTVAKLVGHKPLILNVTNSKSISKLYGPFIEDWAGKKITLYASTAKLAGEMVECLRIRPNMPDEPQQRRALNDDRLNSAILAIKSGTYTCEQLSAYELTLEQKAKVAAALEQTE